MKQRRCKSFAAPYLDQIDISPKGEDLFIARVQFNMKPYLFLLKGLRVAGNNPNAEYLHDLAYLSGSLWAALAQA